MTRTRNAAITLGVIAFVSWVIFSGINNAQEVATRDRQIATFQQSGHVKDQQINALIGQNRVLFADLKASNARTEASNERTVAHDMASARKLTLVLNRLTALLAFVRSKGLVVPSSLLRPVAVSGVTASSSKSACSKKNGKCK